MAQLSDPVAALRAGVAASAAVRRFNDGELALLHGLAYRLYQEGDYLQAARYFSYLTLYRPLNETFLKGLGASQFMARHYEQAAATYAFVLQLVPQDSENFCMYGHSLLLLGDYAAAAAALQVASQHEGPYAARASALIELMQR